MGKKTDTTTPQAMPLPGVLDEVAATLRRAAFLHDDPAAYRAGVEDAIAALSAHLPVASSSPAEVVAA